MRSILAALALLASSSPSSAAALPPLVAVDTGGNANDVAAAKVLKAQLAKANLSVTVVSPAAAKGKPQIAIGYGAALALGVPTARLDASVLLGNDSFLLSGRYGPAGSVVAASAKLSMRGSLLAVSRLLAESGFEFIAPDETFFPAGPVVFNASTDMTFTPLLESRDNNEWPAAKSSDWAGLLGYNGQSAHGTYGGYQKYAAPPGFVHTSYNLLAGETEYDVTKCKRHGSGPCLDVYNAHPEWFWPKNDSTTYGQLCWTEPSLLVELKRAVRDILAKDPGANIISVSQNDNGNYCNTPMEAAVIKEEGSPQGPLLRAVNAIADDIRDDFPHVAVDTLAYQYTRAAPIKTKPRPNVIIRLCSIECNFAAPLTDPTNAPFQKDMEAWAAISNRTYIWNYVTNFGSYLQPFPNYYVVGPNIQYYARHGVKGIFQEGSYTSSGGDMDVLKDYVMGRMLLDPTLNPDNLISTFLQRYYGPAAPHVRLYMDTFHGSIADTGFYMPENFNHNAPFLTPVALLTSKAVLDRGEKVASGQRFAARVRVVKMAVQYVALLRWTELFQFSQSAGMEWPFASSKRAEFDLFNATAQQVGVTAIREGGCNTLGCFERSVFPPPPPAPAPSSVYV